MVNLKHTHTHTLEARRNHVQGDFDIEWDDMAQAARAFNFADI